MTKKAFTLKQDISDNIFSTPKTPAKRVVYKDMIDSSIVDINISSDDVYNNIIDDCHNSNLIGEGDFFLVYKTSKEKTTALKKSIRHIKNVLDYDFYNKECKILKMMDSEYIIKYIDSFTYKSYFYIEVEYCNGGNLREYMTDIFYNKKDNIKIDLINKMMYQISKGLLEIHSKGIIHLDIKPENIYLDYNDKKIITFKIGDFNISNYINCDIKIDGDKKYMAPEVLKNISDYSSDIFSLGLIYLEILKGINLPNKGLAWLNLRRNNFKGIEMDYISRRMLNSNYKKRCHIEEVVNYFSKKMI